MSEKRTYFTEFGIREDTTSTKRVKFDLNENQADNTEITITIPDANGTLSVASSGSVLVSSGTMPLIGADATINLVYWLYSVGNIRHLYWEENLGNNISTPSTLVASGFLAVADRPQVEYWNVGLLGGSGGSNSIRISLRIQADGSVLFANNISSSFATPKCGVRSGHTSWTVA